MPKKRAGGLEYLGYPPLPNPIYATKKDHTSPSPQDSVDDKWLISLFSDHDLSTGIFGEHKGWLQSCETCQRIIQQHEDAAIRNVLVELDGALPEKIHAGNIEKSIPANYQQDDNADTQKGFNTAIDQVHILIQKRLKDE